jgi:hypothetical protein
MIILWRDVTSIGHGSSLASPDTIREANALKLGAQTTITTRTVS